MASIFPGKASKAEIEIKTERLAAMLEREGLDAVLLNAQQNFAWLTGGGTNGVDMSRENGVASILVTRSGKRFILANNIEIKRMIAEEVSKDLFDPIEYSWQGEKAAGSFVVEKARSVLESDAKLAADVPADSVPVIEHKIAPCRYQLTQNEIERYMSLGMDAGLAARSVIEKIKPGQTEIEIAATLQNELAAYNISSVVTLIAADERVSKFRHPVPTANRWRKTLMLVTCAKRDGLVASLTRIVCVGDVPQGLDEKTRAAALVNARLYAATRPGAVGAGLYKTAVDSYAAAGFPDDIDRHHQGGAAGYRTRDWVAHPHSTDVVQPNQAFAWNPSITGTKIEDTIIIGESGFEVITRSPDFPTISVELAGREYLSTGILSI
jgi:Xaa-Pro aminopeptidase